jgi:hypothetical protein
MNRPINGVRPVEIVCCFCMEPAVHRDATAVWDYEKQDWVLIGVQDATYCNNEKCRQYGEEVDVSEVIL